MDRESLRQSVEQFADAHPNHNLALMWAPESDMAQVANVLDAGAAAKKPNTVYVIMPTPAEGELADADVEKVAGGLGDKNVECNRPQKAGASMMIINL
jgi:hypothetical protein